jgi:hypothetical protein
MWAPSPLSLFEFTHGPDPGGGRAHRDIRRSSFALSRRQLAEMFPFMNLGSNTMTTPALMTAGDDDQVCRLQWK